MAVTPQTHGARPWPIIGRLPGFRLPSRAHVERISASEAELLRRVGELPRRPRGSSTDAQGLTGLQRWF